MSTWSEKLRVPVRDDDEFEQSNWANSDLIPINKARRTYGAGSITLFWATGGFSIVNYATGAGFIAYGLSGQQALICAIVAPIILTAAIIPCAWIGASHHIGFTVSQRMVHGLRGSFLIIILRSIPCVVYDGIEAYWGGQAVAAMIGAMAPSYYTALDVDLANGTLKLYNLVGFIIFYIAFLITMRVPPERLQKPFFATTLLFTATVLGMLIWSVKTAGGAGPYFDGSPIPSNGTDTKWGILFGIFAFVGNFSPTTLACMDWTRYSKDRRRTTLVQLFAPFFFFATSCSLGIVVASCSKAILGVPIWQPYEYLQAIQKFYENSSGSRAAVFFAGLSCAAAQVNVNIILNSVSVAMDWSALAPRYINIKRGSYLVAILGLITCPWAVLSSAGTFLAVLAGFGCFYGPLTGTLCVEYYWVRKQHIRHADLYIGNEQSIYWYTKGFNWRATVSFLGGLIPTFPGFIMVVTDLTADNGWVKMYRIAFILGFAVSCLLHFAICAVFPPPHQYVGETTHVDAEPNEYVVENVDEKTEIPAVSVAMV